MGKRGKQKRAKTDAKSSVVAQFFHSRRRFLFVLGGIVLLASALIGYGAFSTYRFSLLADEYRQAMIAEQTVREQANSRVNDTRLQVEAEKAAHDAKKASSDATKEAVLDTPASELDPSSCNSSHEHADPTKIDVLVNKKHCIQPLAFVPELATGSGASLVPEASTAFNKLYSAAAADGMPISVTSSYRSYNTQISTYNRWVAISGKAEADTYSARPGYSEHQTGLALDVAAPGCSLDCFGTTAQYTWMQENAATYGFIQRYYKGEETVTGYSSEEWHYRYVGVSVAQDLKTKGIKSLETYWSMSGGDY